MIAQAQAVRVGLFAIGALVLLVAAVAVVFGARVFASSERVTMQFNGSVRGLEVGAPVVLRGVRVGTVRSITLAVPAAGAGGVQVPVEAELASDLLGPAGLKGLLAQGLTAQLATQSLLTGQLYVELDFRPRATTAAALPVAQAGAQAGAGLTPIPTVGQRFEGLQSQLEALDLQRIAQDLAAVLASAKAFASSPQTQQTLDELAKSSASISRLAQTLEQRSGPLVNRAEQALAGATQSATRVGDAAERAASGVAVAGSRVGAAAARAEALLAPGSPLLASLQQAADDLARSAGALAAATAPEGPAAQQLERTASEVSRAARSLRELSTLLQEQPEALLRGRRDNTGGTP